MQLTPSELMLGVGLAPPAYMSSLPLYAQSFEGSGLFSYQIKLINQIASAMAHGYKRILVVLPTGGGKTHIAKTIIEECIAKAFGAMFLVHRDELIRQTGKSFASGGLDYGLITADAEYNPRKLLQLASVQTLIHRLDVVSRPRLVVIDEGHHSVAATWMEILDRYRDEYVVALTATPERLDGRGLREAGYQILLEGPSVSELIEMGRLSKYAYYGPDIPNTTDLKFGSKDFDDKAAELLSGSKILGSVVDHYLKHAAGKQGIVFAQNIAHSKALEDAFLRAGVKAKHVDGTTRKNDRIRVDEQFRAHEIDLLVNVDLYGEGLDVQGIHYAGLCRITKSLSFHRQSMGRNMRTFPGKDVAIFCDHAGNWLRGLGLPDSPVSWSLDGHRRRGASALKEAEPVKQCKHCFMIVKSGVKVCPRCGEVFAIKRRKMITTDRKARLTLIQKEQARIARNRTPEEKALRKAEERACKSELELLQLAHKRKYPNPTAWAKVKARFIPRRKLPPARLQ